eukprot:scaffold171656_cov22-Tisochrysis_lutea.AAC.1
MHQLKSSNRECGWAQCRSDSSITGTHASGKDLGNPRSWLNFHASSEETEQLDQMIKLCLPRLA